MRLERVIGICFYKSHGRRKGMCRCWVLKSRNGSFEILDFGQEFLPRLGV